ncbi:hypothetical protein AVEN_198200-1 [Araneus ventricosus]|uniref:Uncharacterized protein n=1 Tax=Araneus ventricosus TaxID=182803 RepID=A0A4Y2E5G6_ARAVE|nr:hypothetical protein AVEN_198200-1 [Araneus ventricosus]
MSIVHVFRQSVHCFPSVLLVASIAFSLLPHNRAIIYHFRMTFIDAVNPFLFTWGIYSTPPASEIGSVHGIQYHHLSGQSLELPRFRDAVAAGVERP